MHGLQTCLFKYITDAAYCIYAQCGKDVAKRVVWRLCFLIVMEIALLIMENHGKIMFLNFCGTPDIWANTYYFWYLSHIL